MNGKVKYTIDYIKENNLILLDAISGSHAYGTAIEGISDIDHRGIFLCELDDKLSGDYPDQISDETNDTTYYELGRYFELLKKNNPNILELLNVPEDCVQFRHELLDLIDPDKYISKLCKNTIGGYANQQVKKARGLNKKVVNPISEERKDPLDFCHVVQGHKTISIKSFLKEGNYDQKFCGIVNVPNARDTYALFYDINAYYCFSEDLSEESKENAKEMVKLSGNAMGLGYKGIVGDKGNELRLSSVPKGENAVCVFSYNKDGYTQHCKAYKEYFDWVKKRNPHRYKSALENDYDTKNLLHCYRIAEMGCEIAKGMGIIVRRPNREFLLKIRNGEMEYDEILSLSENLLKESDELFANSDLPEVPDLKEAKRVEIEIRKRFYKL